MRISGIAEDPTHQAECGGLSEKYTAGRSFDNKCMLRSNHFINVAKCSSLLRLYLVDGRALC